MRAFFSSNNEKNACYLASSRSREESYFISDFHFAYELTMQKY